MPKDKPAASASVLAPAKINLTLDVLRRRDDGYHELRSLVMGVDLCDRVRVRAAENGGLRFRCAASGLGGRDNLAWQAAALMASRYDIESHLIMELEKVIPVGAGLGGGSSDAAATLTLCNRLWHLGLDNDALAELGAELGSDVPLFFALPGAVITGRGERVYPVQLRWSGWVLLVFCGVGVSTAEVYRAWRRTDGSGRATETDQAAGEAASADQLASVLSNHLEPAIFRVAPKVARVYDELTRLGFGQVRVSGAGSAMYVLFDDEASARQAAQRIEAKGIGSEAVVARAPFRPPPPAGEELFHGNLRGKSKID